MNTRNIWLNLPVKNVNKSREFYKKVGFELNTHHPNDDQAASFFVGKNKLVLMLFPKDTFNKFINLKTTDIKNCNEVLFSLSAQDRNEVDLIAKKVTRAGGKLYAEPEENQGWMYGCGFKDLDGHKWNVVFMDFAKLTAQSVKADKITISTSVRADVKKVWELWNTPEHIIKWCFASDDWEAPKATNILKTGGRFKTTMSAKNGDTSFDFAGKYTNVDKYKLIAFEMTDGREVMVEFKPLSIGTKIIETFELENTNPKQKQKQGWQNILNNFKKYAEKKS